VAVAQVKREVDALQDLPEQSERITVAKFEPNLPAISLSLVGDADERVMKEAVREIRDDLRSLPRMGEVRMGGVRTDELIVEVRPAAMLEHGLSLPAVAERVRAAMIDVPGGAVRTGRATVSVRTVGAEDAAAAVRAIVVRFLPDGRAVRLDEIADVREGFEDVDVITRVNSKRGLTLTVFKVGREDAVAMAESVKAYAAGRAGKPYARPLRDRLLDVVSGSGTGEQIDRAYELGRSKGVPLPGEIVLTNDLARFIVGRLTTLTEDGLSGAVLIFITLVIVLNLRAAWWVTTGLMVSIFGTLAAMAFLGITLNFLTMFGLIVVLGLLADDAIVISENITARHERGEPAMEAAAKGTNEVYWPVIVPLALIGGQIGDFLSVLPWVVGTALIVSLVEALMILPAHMAHTLRRLERERAGEVRPSRLRRFEKRFDAARDAVFSRYIVPGYLWMLRPCTRRPWLTLSGAAALVIISLGMVAGGRLPFVFFEAPDRADRRGRAADRAGGARPGGGQQRLRGGGVLGRIGRVQPAPPDAPGDGDCGTDAGRDARPFERRGDPGDAGAAPGPARCAEPAARRHPGRPGRG
jgi:multidrug efflux pump subunit AcrB